jgi:hypothetical protein
VSLEVISLTALVEGTKPASRRSFVIVDVVLERQFSETGFDECGEFRASEGPGHLAGGLADVAGAGDDEEVALWSDEGGDVGLGQRADVFG